MERTVRAAGPESLPGATGAYFREEVDPMPHICHKGYFDDTSDLTESSISGSEVPFLTAAMHTCSQLVNQGSLHRCFLL